MTVSTFSANWGSLLTVNVRDRWGFRPCLCQIRHTLFSLSPTALAMLRVLQCVALLGFSCVVFRTTSWILVGAIVGVLPGRGASLSSAAKPPSRNRFRQRAAFSGIILSWAPICLSCMPPAASKTIRARSTIRRQRFGHAHETPVPFAARYSGPQVVQHASSLLPYCKDDARMIIVTI
jgi:hypothetical protein